MFHATDTDFDAEARAAFIGAMRRVASSVTVVTTEGKGGRHGATVSAFCSVSADPPSVLVCLKADSRIAEAVSANKSYCVNVLPCRRDDIADRFAGRHDHEIADRFDGISWDVDTGAAPALPEATVFDCRLARTVDCGSHRIFIANVVATKVGASSALAYHDGAYHCVVPQGSPSFGAGIREAAQ